MNITETMASVRSKTLFYHREVNIAGWEQIRNPWCGGTLQLRPRSWKWRVACESHLHFWWCLENSVCHSRNQNDFNVAY